MEDSLDSLLEDAGIEGTCSEDGMGDTLYYSIVYFGCVLFQNLTNLDRSKRNAPRSQSSYEPITRLPMLSTMLQFLAGWTASPVSLPINQCQSMLLGDRGTCV